MDAFLERTASEYRARLALLGDSGERRALEDAVALLADARHWINGVDGFKALVASLRGRRARVSVLRPSVLADDLERRWQAYSDAARRAGAARELAFREVG
jgi:hypothetical protein